MALGNKGGGDFFSSAAQTAAWGRLVGRHIGSRNGPEHCKIVHLNGEVPSGSGYKGPIPHPLPSASKCVLLRGRVCGASSQAGLLFLRLGRYLGVVVLGNLGNLVRRNIRNRAGACWEGGCGDRAGGASMMVSLTEGKR